MKLVLRRAIGYRRKIIINMRIRQCRSGGGFWFARYPLTTNRRLLKRERAHLVALVVPHITGATAATAWATPASFDADMFDCMNSMTRFTSASISKLQTVPTRVDSIDVTPNC